MKKTPSNKPVTRSSKTAVTHHAHMRHAQKTAKPSTAESNPPYVVKRSKIRGRGVYAARRIRRGTRARLHRHWGIFADMFPAPVAFYGGGAPGALDLLATVVSKWSGTRAHLKQARPQFFELFERVESHPAVAAVFAHHWPSQAPTS